MLLVPNLQEVFLQMEAFVIDPYIGQLAVLNGNVMLVRDDITVQGEDVISGLIRWEGVSNQKATFRWD